MRFHLIISLFSLLVTSCSSLPDIALTKVHKSNVIQGNVITDEMVATLRPGLTRKQVHYIMGTPLISDIFDNNRWDYVYEKRRPDDTVENQQISIYFRDNLLVSFK